jgi:hypothetical protein
MNHSQLSAIFKVAAHNFCKIMAAPHSLSSLGEEFPALHAGLLRALIKDGLKFEPKSKTRERNAFSVSRAVALNAYAHPYCRPAKQPLTVLCV